MSTLSFEKIAKKVEPIAKQYQVPKVSLFGSYARGEATEQSDIDLVFDATDSQATGILKKNNFKRELENQLNKKVDLIRLESVQQLSKYFESMKATFDEEGTLLYADKEKSSTGSQPY